jgi:hypothetical protein
MRHPSDVLEHSEQVVREWDKVGEDDVVEFFVDDEALTRGAVELEFR